MNKRFMVITTLSLLLLVVGGGVLMSGNFAYASQEANPLFVAGAAAEAEEVAEATEAGIVIIAVESDSAAQKAGVKRGNILLQVDEVAINEASDLRSHLKSLKAGDEVVLTVLHGDEKRSLTATLEERDQKAYLGVEYAPVIERELIEEISCMEWEVDGHDFELPEGISETLLIEDVIAGEAAEAAGLQAGDQILALDGESLTTGEGFVAALRGHNPGDTVILTIQRAGEPQDVEVVLGANEAGEAFLGIGLGVEVEIERIIEGEGSGPFADFDFDAFGLPDGESLNGAIIHQVDADGAAAAAGLQKGDVITAIEGQELEALEDLTNALEAHAAGDTVTLTIRREGEAEAQELNVTLGEGDAKLGVQVGFVRVERHQNSDGSEIEESQEFFFEGSAP